MAADQPPVGQRFSHVYIERGAPTRDSARLRVRLCAYFRSAVPQDLSHRLADAVRSELGVVVPSEYGYAWEVYFGKFAVRDVLDTITLVSAFLQGAQREKWLKLVQRAFDEENVGYKVDSQGGVHLSVDTEFERNRAASIAALQSGRYAAALAAFEQAHKALDGHPPDGKGAIRDAFEAAEIVFKLMFDVPRLGAAEIGSHLRPLVRKLYDGNEPAIDAANQFLESFAKWTNAAHHYRHGQGVEEPTPPPLDFAVASVSAGASYVRWLAELDARAARASGS